MSNIHSLTSYSLAPYSERSPEQLVILLHGYGANGEDLLDLATHWRQTLPSVGFIAPNAPFASEASAFGRQWFSLQSMDEETLRHGIQEALPHLHAFIDSLLARYHLTEDQLALVGFSQGAMMALSALLTRRNPFAGVLGYSGAFIPDPHQTHHASGAVLLIHGDSDEVIRIEAQSQAAKALTAVGITVRTHVCRGLGHSIDMKGLALGGEFLTSVFNKNSL